MRSWQRAQQTQSSKKLEMAHCSWSIGLGKGMAINELGI